MSYVYAGIHRIHTGPKQKLKVKRVIGTSKLSFLLPIYQLPVPAKHLSSYSGLFPVSFHLAGLFWNFERYPGYDRTSER